jgi:hypothetical protein
VSLIKPLATIFLNTFRESIGITVIVFSTMILLDYFHAGLRERFEKFFQGRFARPFLIASLLGAAGGCTGAFISVSAYMRGIIGIGPVISAMIATLGDETYVMFAMIPGKTVLFLIALFVVGIAGGMLAEKTFRLLKITLHPSCGKECHGPFFHSEDTGCIFSLRTIRENLFRPSFAHCLLYAILVTFIVGFATGKFESDLWSFENALMIGLLVLNLFVITAASEHYLHEHVWKHLVKQHVGKIFLWTVGTLLIINLSLHFFNLSAFFAQKQNLVWILIFAALVGIIPESGPHIIFVTMFARHLIPFSIMLTNSMVQDGHGLLPLLSVSWKDAVKVKAFSFCFGLLVGLFLLLLGF